MTQSSGSATSQCPADPMAAKEYRGKQKYWTCEDKYDSDKHIESSEIYVMCKTHTKKERDVGCGMWSDSEDEDEGMSNLYHNAP